MRAAFITGRRSLEVREVPTPEPGPDQVRIRVTHVGICGSDLHYYFDGANGAFPVLEPLTPGHEMSGTVDLDPSGTWTPGTPVTVHPARFGRPSPALAGSPHLWPGGSYLGSAATVPHTQGALAQLLVVERPMVRVLPEGLPLRRAALAEPLAVAMHAVARAGDVTGRDVLVSGAGPIGLLAIAAARAAGAARVAAADVVPGPLERAAGVGADLTHDVTAAGVPREYDVVLECSGAAAAVTTALAATRPTGTVVLVGMMPADPRPVGLAPVVGGELTVVGSFRFRDEIDDAVRLLAAQPHLERVVTHEFTATDAASIVQALTVAGDSAASGKVLVRTWP